MKHITIILAFLMMLSSPVAAQDFDKGATAAQAGDYATAILEWLPLALGGDSDSQFNLGLLYRIGKGVTQDDAKAVKWYRLAAQQGNTSAQQNLGYMYENGKGISQDYNEAVKWYKLAAEQGLSDSQFSLGSMYDRGKGVPRDYDEAFKWFMLAAEQGNKKSLFNLGNSYYYGQGVPKDLNFAIKWFKLAAEQGNKKAQHTLGYIYMIGQGISQDYGEAVKWYKLAAQQGFSSSQGNLGLLYLKGYGVPQDNLLAHMWSSLGKNFTNVGLAAENMTPEDITKAQQMAEECVSSNYKNCGSQIISTPSEASACEGFAKLGAAIAEARDQGRSQESILKAVLDNIGMRNQFAKNMVASIYKDFSSWDPTTIKEFTLRACLEDSSVLAKSMK